MSKIKSLAGETALYGLGSIVPRALIFFLLPLHTRHLFTPEQYGVVTNLMAYVGFLNIVYTFGMETAFFRFATSEGADPRRIFNLVQTIVICVGLILSLPLVVFATPIAAWLHVADHPEFVAWLVFVMLIDSLVAIPFTRLRLQKRPLRFAAAKLINVIIILLLNFYFLKLNYDPSIGVGYVFLANLLGNAFLLIFFARDLSSWRPAFDTSLSPRMLNYAYPVMLMGLAAMTNEMFSRLTLEWWLPDRFYGDKSQAYALGVFGACYKYAVLMSLAVQSFRYAAEPFFFSNASDRNSPALFARVNHFFVIVCCVLLLGVSINMDVLKFIVGREYWEGISIVPLLLLAYLFLGIYYNFSVWFKVTDRTYIGTLITTAGAILTILLNYLLIPVAGYTGSSWATLAVYFFMAAVCYGLGQKFYPIPYHLLSDLGYIALTTGLVFVIGQIQLGSLWLSIPFHAGVVVVFLFVVYLLETRGRASTGVEQSASRQ